jgi:hypothetical protein
MSIETSNLETEIAEVFVGGAPVRYRRVNLYAPGVARRLGYIIAPVMKTYGI